MSVLLLYISACGDPKAGDIASQCGEKTCPVGTTYEEYRSMRDGYDIDLAVDPTTYSGELAFKNFEEGECKWTCVLIQGCPEGTFPVISEDCFTCGAITDDGQVLQGSCDSGS